MFYMLLVISVLCYFRVVQCALSPLDTVDVSDVQILHSSDGNIHCFDASTANTKVKYKET